MKFVIEKTTLQEGGFWLVEYIAKWGVKMAYILDLLRKTHR